MVISTNLHTSAKRFICVCFAFQPSHYVIVKIDALYRGKIFKPKKKNVSYANGLMMGETVEDNMPVNMVPI